MSADGSPGTNTNVIDPFMTVNVCWNELNAIQSRTSNNSAPNIISGFSSQLMVSRVFNNLNGIIPEQLAKIRAYFNYYDEYRIVRYVKHYQPNFRGTDMASFTSSYAAIFQSEAEPEDHQNYMMAVAFLDTSSVTYLPDPLGLPIRNTFDELYQAQARSDSRTFKLNEPYTWIVQPTDYELRQAPVINVQSVNVLNGRVPLVSSFAQNNNNTFIQTGGPKMMDFVPTKAVNPTGGAVQYNWDLPYNGWRQYYYFPMNESISPVGIETGLYMNEFTIEFRKPSYGPMLTVPGFAALSSMTDADALEASLQTRRLPVENTQGPEFKQGQSDIDVQLESYKRHLPEEEKEPSDQPPITRVKT